MALRGEGGMARTLLLLTPPAHARTPLYRKVQFHLKAAEPKLGFSFLSPLSHGTKNLPEIFGAWTDLIIITGI